MALRVLGVQVQRQAVDAVALAGRGRAVGEDMAEVGAAAGADDLGADHAVAVVGSQLDPLYSMTKGGVTLFTKSTALEFGRKGYKIRVNSIHPGLIETDMGQQTFAMRARQQGTNDTEKARQATVALHPIGRLGVADDIAKGIVFLASDDASFMTGAGLVVDGGWTAH